MSKRAREADYDDLGPGMGGGMGGGLGGDFGAFPCVKLRGLPFEVAEEDIKQFLGLEPVDIVFVRRDGRVSGEAFVVLGSPSLVDVALSKHKMYLGSRYVEITRSRKLDYYKAVANEYIYQRGESGLHVGPMQPRGAGMGMGVQGGGMGGVGGGMGGLGLPSMGGIGGMGMGSMGGMAAGMGNMGGDFGGMGDGMGGLGMGISGGMGSMGMGGGDGFGIGMGGMGGGLGMGGMGGGMGGMSSLSGRGTTWVKMRGLPFSATADDIMMWFDDPSLGLPRLDRSRVYMWNEGGRPSGMALIEFPTAADATKALQKSKQIMGSRYIELFAATRADLEKYQRCTDIVG